MRRASCHSGRIGDVAAWEQDGRRIALIAFSFTSGSHPLNDTEGARALVAELAAQNDLVIVSFHGGAEGGDATRVPFTMERFFGEDRGNVVEFGRAMVDAGADLVLGHGPHVARAIEVYHDRLIAYSLGNFATYFGISVEGIKGYAPILKATIDTDGRLLDGRIVSGIQVRPDGVKLDPEQRAFRLIRDMTAARSRRWRARLRRERRRSGPRGRPLGGCAIGGERRAVTRQRTAARHSRRSRTRCPAFRSRSYRRRSTRPRRSRSTSASARSRIKRDDLTSPVYGGNKVRKLDYLLADALARGCDTVVTFGAAGSNHALATAVFAQRLGLACHVVLMHQAVTPYVAATLRYHLHIGTILHAARSFNHSREVFEQIRDAHPQGPGRVVRDSLGRLQLARRGGLRGRGAGAGRADRGCRRRRRPISSISRPAAWAR